MTKRRAKEAPDFVVEDRNGAMLNTNNRALLAYRKQRAANRKLFGLTERVDAIESTLNNIERMLEFLLKATNNDGPRAQ
jgi:hypothetical protein